MSSNPSMFGIITSASTRSGQRSWAAAQRLSTVARDAHVVAGRPQLDLEQPCDERVVVDDQQALAAADLAGSVNLRSVLTSVTPTPSLGFARGDTHPPRVRSLESALYPRRCSASRNPGVCHE